MWIDKQSDDIFFLRFLASSRAGPYLRFWYLEPFRVDLSAVFPMYIFFIFPSSLCIHRAECVAVAMRDSALRSVWRTYVFPVEAERSCLSVWSLPTEHRAQRQRLQSHRQYRSSMDDKFSFSSPIQPLEMALLGGFCFCLALKVRSYPSSCNQHLALAEIR